MSSVIKPPSYQRWLRKAYWCLDEAVSLLLGIDPKGRFAAFEDPAVRDEYLDLLDSALRSEKRDLSIISSCTHETLMGTAYARVEPTEIVKWAQRLGYLIPSELLVLLESDDLENSESEATLMPTNSAKQSVLGANATDSELEGKPKLKKIEKRLRQIQKVISDLGYQPLALPTGGKRKVKDECLKNATLFTESTFDKAWQEGRRRGRVKMLEHENFLQT